MISHPEIRKQILNFLRDDIDIEQFDDWMVENSWNIHERGDIATQRLCFAIELKLAEYSAGHLSENALKQELLPLMIPYETTSPVARSESTLSFSPLTWSVQSADTRLSLESLLQAH